MKICDRCFENYPEDEIIKFDKNSDKMICLPCKYEFDFMLQNLLIKFFNQPERSKREDLNQSDYDLANFVFGKIDWNELKMRCSELCGNVERPAEKIWPA